MKKLSILVILTAFVIVLAACGAKTTTSSDQPTVKDTAAAANTQNTQELKISAKNFQFDQAEYKVKKGVPVKITLVMTEGTHGLAIPDLGVNLSGDTLSQVVTPATAGTFELRCAVMCGSGHSKMKAKITVEE